MEMKAFSNNASSNEAKTTVIPVSSENSPRRAVSNVLRLLKGKPVIGVNTDLNIRLLTRSATYLLC